MFNKILSNKYIIKKMTMRASNVKGYLKNANSYLNISTYDGSFQNVHPCVLYTDISWNGFNYIMAYTPYPYSNDSYENPSIRGSNDGINWYMWPGQPDPIIPAPSVGFYSDPSIVLYNYTLYLYYRYNDKINSPSVNNIFLVKCANPNLWSPPLLTDLPYIRSPSFINDGSLWQCWGHDMKSGVLKHFSSNNSINWEENSIVSCNIPGYILWHSEIKKIDDIYFMLMTAHKPNSENEVFLFYSYDGKNWKYSTKNPLICPNRKGWDNKQIYKSSLVKVKNKFKIWYSAMNKNNIWHIGFIDDIDKLI